MKKVLKIKRKTIDSSDYYVFEDENETQLFVVDCRTKTIKGQDLYSSVYGKVDPGTILEIEIDQAILSAEDKKVFGNYVADLFNSINEAMKIQFTPSKTEIE